MESESQQPVFGDSRPLAERLRPSSIAEFIGQRHILGPGKLLERILASGRLPSLILWGPPGSGKTTLARLLARDSRAEFVFFSAVFTGVKEIRAVLDKARSQSRQGVDTILFVDEIHRFNKSQQDGFLPYVENGLITLIGATTENPSFQIIPPLLSRCRVLTLSKLDNDDLRAIGQRALDHSVHGLAREGIYFEQDGFDYLVAQADGDARRLLNSLEIAASLVADEVESKRTVTLEMIQDAFARDSLQYDRTGEEHYNLISAFHKSLRDSDPDGALYWLCRMLAAGEDPLYLARRMVRFASEDIGNADPQALQVSIQARESYQMLGSPEGELALAQAAAYLATAPKSNRIYSAYKKVMGDIRKTGSLPVPLHIRNAPTSLLKNLGYGKDYQYAHNDPLALVSQSHLPEELEGTVYYEPVNRGYEAVIRDRLSKWRRILAERKSSGRGG